MSNSAFVDKLSDKEKIKLMEELWASLREPVEKYNLPDWHDSELENREVKVSKKESSFTEWNTAKKEINNSIK
ncbi:MAG: addiction module protein [Balneola sp.]|jgi:putative addiction module component (TIGR02574 family)